MTTNKDAMCARIKSILVDSSSDFFDYLKDSNMVKKKSQQTRVEPGAFIDCTPMSLRLPGQFADDSGTSNLTIPLEATSWLCHVPPSVSTHLVISVSHLVISGFFGDSCCSQSRPSSHFLRAKLLSTWGPAKLDHPAAQLEHAATAKRTSDDSPPGAL